MIQPETISSVSYAFWQGLGVLQSASDRMFSWRCMAKKLIEHSEKVCDVERIRCKIPPTCHLKL